jgi:hypothetical protein
VHQDDDDDYYADDDDVADEAENDDDIIADIIAIYSDCWKKIAYCHWEMSNTFL